MLNMVCVGASSEIQHKKHDFGKSKAATDASDNWVVYQVSFLKPRSAVPHRKFHWYVKASDNNQRDEK